MLFTSSSFSNDSSPDHPAFSSTNTFNLYCFTTTQSKAIMITYWCVRVALLIPLCTIILYHGVQQQRQGHLMSSPAAMTHSDIFTYHVAVMELIGVFGNVLCCYGFLHEEFSIAFGGILIGFFSWYGETVFHILTCLERYLAVIHPITYMKLRNKRGIRIRNGSIGCAWLLCFMGMGSMMRESVYIILNLSVLAVALLAVLFCSLSVLQVLIRPGPGEQGGMREKVDQSKKRAFHTIAAIFWALALRFFGSLVWITVYASEFNNECLILVSIMWLSIPSSLVLPLLFLHRARNFKLYRVTFDPNINQI